ncbi:MerR family DNA-binding protein [Actinomyces mediterranea]|uniref:MerR family DNA-binding protein n=1 Tax=Actinomyces mediterranea TaxID=1871028 RepID=UPI00135663E1|nr:MerR family DNA-binding protein [Actinomyces mediterranea]
MIECLKRSGLSIKQIKDFMHMVVEGDATLGDRLALFRGRRKVVEQDIRELKRVLDVLDYKIWYYEQAVANGSESAVGSLPIDKIPARHRAVQAYLAGSRQE